MTTAALELDYLSLEEVAAQPAPWWHNVLGVVGFGKPPHIERPRVPVTASMTPSIGASGDLCEVWRVVGASELQSTNGMGDDAMRRDHGLRQGRVHYRYCKDLLFGSFTIEERVFGDSGVARLGTEGNYGALAQATMAAYGEIFEVLGKTEHHLIRVWNYLPEINRESDGDERYRHFNAARQTAFRISGRPTEVAVPAACALGSPPGSPLSIYFLAARAPALMIENPRQTSAYHYPPKFGRLSPSFSRACLLRESSGTNLFLSGTASIVGYETMHAGDVAAQTRETLANIETLLTEANRLVGEPRYSLDALKFKVYVRRPTDLDVIRDALSASLRPSTPVVYLQADVCREDLLVEIEAAGGPRSAS